jgi:hypothetical protein
MNRARTGVFSKFVWLRWAWPMIFLLALGGSAGAQQKVLGVPLFGQHTKMWCFAATTQMIGAYFGGTSLEQCKIAAEAYTEDNVSFDTSTCCTNEQACTGNGHKAYDSLKYWGYKQTRVQHPPLFSDIKSWIDDGSPVATRLDWTGGGDHWIVVDGYWMFADGTRWVEVLNPLPTNTGDKEWFTFSGYLNGGVGDKGGQPLPPHTITDTLHAIHWEPVCTQDFDDLNWTLYGQCQDQWSGRGLYASDLATGLEGLTYQMGGSFRSVNGRPVAWNASYNEFTNFVGNYPAFRPERITVSSGSPMYSGILTPETSAWQSVYANDFDQFQNKADNMDAQGYRLRDIFGYRSNGSTRFSGVWVKETGGYHYRFDHPLSDLDDTSNGYPNFRLARISTYQDSSGTWRYAALWLPWGNVTVSHYNKNMSESEYESYYQTQTNNGFTLAYLSKYGQYYNAIFTK